MSSAPVCIAERYWDATPDHVRCLLLEVLEQIQQHKAQLEAVANRIPQLEEQRGRNSRNSSKPPSSDGPDLIDKEGVG